MRTLAIIQARMGSKRLPGKVLMPLGNHNALEWCRMRVANARTVDAIVIATSSLAIDNPIIDLCSVHGWLFHRGSEHDVLDRFYQAARLHQPIAVVRITADCPLIDPDIVDYVVSAFHAQTPPLDYLSNVHPRTFPKGLDVEIFSFSALERAWREADEPHSREHVTPHFYQNPAQFNLGSVTNREDLSERRWTLDTEDDLRALQALTIETTMSISWTELISRGA